MGTYTVHPTAVVGMNTKFGTNVVVHANAVIGDDVELEDNVVIYEGTKIGHGVVVGANSVIGKQPLKNKRVKRQTSPVQPLIIGNHVSIGACVVLFAGSVLKDDVLVGDLASIREQVQIGESSVVGRAVTVELNTIVGDRVVLQSGSYITGDTIIQDDVFIGPEVSMSNDKYMGLVPFKYSGPIIESHARVGNNATLLPGVRIGSHAVVGAGAVVTKDVSPNDVVAGVPAARITTQLRGKGEGQE